MGLDKTAELPEPGNQVAEIPIKRIRRSKSVATRSNSDKESPATPFEVPNIEMEVSLNKDLAPKVTTIDTVEAVETPGQKQSIGEIIVKVIWTILIIEIFEKNINFNFRVAQGKELNQCGLIQMIQR